MRYIFIFILIFLNIFSNFKLSEGFRYDYLLIGDRKLAKVLKYGDLWGIIFGLRRVFSDIAFIQEVIYYGTPEYKHSECHKHKHRHIHLHFHPHLKLFSYAKRVLRIDYHFHFATLFSAASLAFVQERPEEAIELLKEAIEYRSDFIQYSLYLGAITLRKEKGERVVVPLLRKLVKKRGAPDELKNYFAILCEKFGYIEDALNTWRMLLSSRNPIYRERAKRHIRMIKTENIKVLTFPD